MATLTPFFSTNRMMREYVEKIYIPSSRVYSERIKNSASVAEELYRWQTSIDKLWAHVYFGDIQIERKQSSWEIKVPVYTGELNPSSIQVQIFADPVGEKNFIPVNMNRNSKLPGSVHGYSYTGIVPDSRPADDYTVRVIPFHRDAFIPLENNRIIWQR
jgi:starch phosphorylase